MKAEKQNQNSEFFDNTKQVEKCFKSPVKVVCVGVWGQSVHNYKKPTHLTLSFNKICFTNMSQLCCSYQEVIMTITKKYFLLEQVQDGRLSHKTQDILTGG